jgi:hypothetical protein
MGQKATIAEAGAAIRTAEFVGIQNLISALRTFYTAIDELKHRCSFLDPQNDDQLPVICHQAPTLKLLHLAALDLRPNVFEIGYDRYR